MRTRRKAARPTCGPVPPAWQRVWPVARSWHPPAAGRLPQFHGAARYGFRATRSRQKSGPSAAANPIARSRIPPRPRDFGRCAPTKQGNNRLKPAKFCPVPAYRVLDFSETLVQNKVYWWCSGTARSPPIKKSRASRFGYLTLSWIYEILKNNRSWVTLRHGRRPISGCVNGYPISLGPGEAIVQGFEFSGPESPKGKHLAEVILTVPGIGEVRESGHIHD